MKIIVSCVLGVDPIYQLLYNVFTNYFITISRNLCLKLQKNYFNVLRIIITIYDVVEKFYSNQNEVYKLSKLEFSVLKKEFII